MRLTPVLPRAMPAFLSRLDQRDRRLFDRWVLGAGASPLAMRCWRAVTHAGSAAATVPAAAIPLGMRGVERGRASLALIVLIASHVIVQLVKRTVGRPRPRVGSECQSLVEAPDRFSFPSGHAAAAMSIAIGYSAIFPSLAVPLLILAVAVGMSRVVLAVHYPGDVLAAEAIAILTALVVLNW